jgi:ABC-type protease/lipase transport system fused ATPase/permease subunit
MDNTSSTNRQATKPLRRFAQLNERSKGEFEQSFVRLGLVSLFIAYVYLFRLWGGLDALGASLYRLGFSYALI